MSEIQTVTAGMRYYLFEADLLHLRKQSCFDDNLIQGQEAIDLACEWPRNKFMPNETTEVCYGNFGQGPMTAGLWSGGSTGYGISGIVRDSVGQPSSVQPTLYCLFADGEKSSDLQVSRFDVWDEKQADEFGVYSFRVSNNTTNFIILHSSPTTAGITRNDVKGV